ncbi:MAG: RDD family protein [Bacteroidia bacterium]
MINLFDILNSNHVAMVGTEHGNDVVLDDAEVSAKHCQITKIEEGKYLIVDLGSSTGTFVNNNKIEKEFINDTDFVTIGSTIFQIGKKIKEAEQHSTETPSTQILNEEKSVEPKQPIHSNHKKIIVYFLAAPEDESVCKAIDKHLSAVRFNSALPIEIYGDFKIPAGDDKEIYKKKLFEADIVLAFISVDFINNNECYERNQKVIVKYNKQETILLPILVRNCMWKATPFANLPLLPKNLQPLNNKQFWNSEDDALTAVVSDIYNSINDFTDKNADDQPLKNATPAPALKVDWRGEYNQSVFWKRVAAYLLDALIIMFPIAIILYIIGLMMGIESAAMDGSLTYVILIVTAQMMVNSILESSSWQATPGKRIMKLQITDNAGHSLTIGQAIKRNFIKLLMVVMFQNPWLNFVIPVIQIGYFIKNKNFIHDKLSNTVIGEKLN